MESTDSGTKHEKTLLPYVWFKFRDPEAPNHTYVTDSRSVAQAHKNDLGDPHEISAYSVKPASDITFMLFRPDTDWYLENLENPPDDPLEKACDPPPPSPTKTSTTFACLPKDTIQSSEWSQYRTAMEPLTEQFSKSVTISDAPCENPFVEEHLADPFDASCSIRDSGTSGACTGFIPFMMPAQSPAPSTCSSARFDGGGGQRGGTEDAVSTMNTQMREMNIDSQVNKRDNRQNIARNKLLDTSFFKSLKGKNDVVAEDPSKECMICYGNKASVALISCGHAKFCIECVLEYFAPKGRLKPESQLTCPVCKDRVSMCVVVYSD